jgi:transcriptional regulator with GAF, ATPase, and Fis domain
VTSPLASLLVARFVELPGGRALDLATGRQVVVRRRALDPIARAVWPVVIQQVTELWHPAIAECVDFGFTPAGDWFEAYSLDERAFGDATTASRFLAASGVDCALVPREAGGRAGPLVPAFPDDERRVVVAGHVPVRGFGMRLVPRAIEALVGCAIAEGRLGGPLVWSIDAPSGCGWKTTWRRLARAARLAGCVPIDHSLLELPCGPHQRGTWLGALSGTALVIVAEQPSWQPARRRHLAQLLVRLGGLDAISIIVLDVVRAGRPEPARHRLTALSADALAEALWVPPRYSPHWLRARAVAEATHGLPGPFVQAVAERLGLDRATPMVHERPEGGETSGEPAQAASAALRRAAVLVGRGRRAAADRFLAKTMGVMSRRGESSGRGRLLVARAEVLAARGDLARSRLLWMDATLAELDPPTLADAACRIALHWVRHGALQPAERLLVGAAAGLRAMGLSPPASLTVPLMYARCWQARWRDALDTDTDDEGRVGRVWPALELDDVAAAAEHLRVARMSARTIDARWFESAELRLDIAIGAEARLERAAVADRPPAGDLLADEARLLPLEGLTRLGATLTAAMRSRVRKHLRPSSPRLARARARLVLAVEACRGDRPAALVSEVARVVRATRARALAYGESRISCWRREPPEATSMLNDLISVLRTCQAHDDPRVALTHVARLVAERLQADGVTMVGRGGRGDTSLATAGGHDVAGCARRAMDAGAAVAATKDGASDVAVPVRLGDLTTGAIGVRWVMAEGGSSPHAVALLEAVATAIAPTVRLAVELAPRQPATAVGSALVGISAPTERVRAAVESAARAPFRVLIEGESGSGKELVAREIHRLGPRRARAFCAINCAALTDELCEAELFGHARGAYTGALNERAGLFEEADGGTLFLDEVSELSPRAQAKLLRALQEGEIRRLGETRPRKVDVRLIAATNRPLAQAVEAGQFRADLRYRLDVIHITVPPLRDRPEDVALLTEQFWQRAIEGVGSRAQLSADAVAALARYHWPGNVRELQNVLSAVAAEAPPRGLVRESALPPGIAARRPPPRLTLEQARRLSDERAIREALAHAGGHRGRAAVALGLTRQGLAKIVDRLQLDTTPGAVPAP